MGKLLFRACETVVAGLAFTDDAGFFLTCANAPPDRIRKAKTAIEILRMKFILIRNK
jgi:hypothetical protein